MAQPAWPEQLAHHLHRQEERAHVKDHAEKVFPCDGADPQLVKQFLRELELVPMDCRLQVFERMARGSLLREFLHWQRGNNAVPLDQRWGPLKTHVLAAFVSQDTDGTMKKELFKCKRGTSESIVSFNRRFRELAAEAYPLRYDPQGVVIPRNRDQVEALVKTSTTYCFGAASDAELAYQGEERCVNRVPWFVFQRVAPAIMLHQARLRLWNIQDPSGSFQKAMGCHRARGKDVL
ncbi:hypothetical protein CAPTEDRAFT_187156 [Capitella teleta]|uniref:Retrotransposon gag domain-containing protein n=1 Tax=Capitella teleta TaxID=283909 RepID=R7VHK9_CAPTE|nr:hypothetical protein CAPTEDRAFT_187156 [Capitella teleta]|eukprot:ELU18104.1 hypothetical protein CAPTEDRAFT_187156 [Capitella teleta]